MKRATFLASLLSIAACGGGGPYGFAHEYAPFGDEETHMDAAAQVSYEDVRRDPADFQSVTVGWFGVITEVGLDENGSGTIAVTHRTLAARNLCADERSSSCRVTVSERAGGPWTAQLTVRVDDLGGEDRVWIGSLVKVYGTPTGELDPEHGGPVLEAAWYRHWPRGKFVTTGARNSMRR